MGRAENDSELVGEIERRRRNVSSMAVEQGINFLVLVDPNNVYYLSGFRTTLHTRFTAVVVGTSSIDNCMVIVPSVDRKLALEDIWSPSRIPNTQIYYDGAPEGGPRANNPVSLLKTVLTDGQTIGMDFSGATYDQFQLLSESFPSSTFVDASEILHTVRRTKSSLELDLIRRANTIAVECFNSVLGALTRGITEIDLALLLDSAARRFGADGFAYPTLIGFGQKSLAPHAPPTLRSLEDDQIVTVAFGPMYRGYCADIVRTFYYGLPPADVVGSAENSLAMQDAAMSKVAAGVRSGDLMKAALKVLAANYPEAPRMGRAGHSLGLTVHETPSLTPDNDMILEPDMVLAIEPSGVPFAMENHGLYRQCDVVRVTTNGCERLTTFARGLQVASSS